MTKYQHLKPPASFTGSEHCLNLNWTSIDFSHVLHPPVTFYETHWTHVTHCQCRPFKSYYWLLVSTILKNMSSSMGRMTSPILWKIKTVWNHQPVTIYTPSKIAEQIHTTRPDASPSRPFFHDFGPEDFLVEVGALQISQRYPVISTVSNFSTRFHFCPTKKKASSANLPAVAINVAHFPVEVQLADLPHIFPDLLRFDHVFIHHGPWMFHLAHLTLATTFQLHRTTPQQPAWRSRGSFRWWSADDRRGTLRACHRDSDRDESDESFSTHTYIYIC